jgi:hypothetical protein
VVSGCRIATLRTTNPALSESASFHSRFSQPLSIPVARCHRGASLRPVALRGFNPFSRIILVRLRSYRSAVNLAASSLWLVFVPKALFSRYHRSLCYPESLRCSLAARAYAFEARFTARRFLPRLVGHHTTDASPRQPPPSRAGSFAASCVGSRSPSQRQSPDSPLRPPPAHNAPAVARVSRHCALVSRGISPRSRGCILAPARKYRLGSGGVVGLVQRVNTTAHESMGLAASLPHSPVPTLATGSKATCPPSYRLLQVQPPSEAELQASYRYT